ncbi:hypothetical protein NL676_034854 [Syzygium grande]|nr:hypothetical protein NL676_034854 [Syzygium grande]
MGELGGEQRVGSELGSQQDGRSGGGWAQQAAGLGTGRAGSGSNGIRQVARATDPHSQILGMQKGDETSIFSLLPISLFRPTPPPSFLFILLGCSFLDTTHQPRPVRHQHRPENTSRWPFLSVGELEECDKKPGKPCDLSFSLE